MLGSMSLTENFAEWLSSNPTSVIHWNTTQAASFVYHQAWLDSPSFMQEANDMTEDARVYYAMQSVCDTISSIFASDTPTLRI